MTIIKEKWIDLQKTTFVESKEEDKDHVIEALIVPFDKISRNGVQYSKESIEAKHNNLVEKPIFFNHQTSGAGDEFLPRGEWNETWLAEDGMHARGSIFKTDYNKGLLEYLSHAKNPKVSLQITGDAKSEKTEEGKYFQKATIQEFLESSVVSLPGFIDASAKFESMCESLNKDLNSEEKIMEESVDTKKSIVKLIDVYSDISKMKDLPTTSVAKARKLIDELKSILKQESAESDFFEKLLEVRESMYNKYKTINIEETDDGFVVYSYQTEQKLIAKNEEELVEAVKKILNTSVKSYDDVEVSQ